MRCEPPLKWAGGKRWQVPWLRRVWTPHRRLVEPFCGGLAVALGLEPERALLNDANPHVINFYQHVARGFTYDLDLDAALYYEHRDWFNTLVREGLGHTEMAAQLFYYLNRVGFNGLCRFSKDGTFNVPVGTARSVPTLDVAGLQRVLAPWTFTNGDFEEVTTEPDDFLYIDPPYDAGFTAYTSGPFTWADQERVAMLYASHPGPVVLCNRATDRILSLYQKLGYHLITSPAPRRVGGDHAPVLEVIATNFPVEAGGMMDLPEGATEWTPDTCPRL
jgi:DNA adenine methylase